MMRHTLKSLGPRVLATRMVRDYVRTLYAPAAVNARSLNGDYAGARELAAWKGRIRSGWEGVRVEHVEGTAPRSPEVGARLDVRAFVALGALAPEDVDVQLVHGRTDEDDVLVDTAVTLLAPVETYDGGRYCFAGDVVLQHAGAFGYTVRVVPRNAHLTSVAELGVVAVA
jgi:starch phosphorylase